MTPEAWTDHFEIVEITPGGRTVKLTSSPSTPEVDRLVDIRSKVIIRRTSKTPTVIKSRYKHHETYFGVKVEVTHNGCPQVLPIANMNRQQTKDPEPIPGCKPRFTTYNLDIDIAHGDSFRIDTAPLRHGDSVNIRLLGKRVDERLVSSDSCDKRLVVFPSDEEETLKRAHEARVCPSTLGVVPGEEKNITFYAVDYKAIAPYEVRTTRRRTKYTKTTAGTRFDAENQLAISPYDPSKPFDDPTKNFETFKAHAIAREGDGEPRAVPCTKDDSFVACGATKATKFKDGETVTIVISRPLVVDGKQVDEEISRYELEAAGLGLHWAPFNGKPGSDIYRAYYSTASVLAVEWGNGQDPRPTFAQTFAYSLYWKHRTARWVEAFSVGAHLAVLGNTRDQEDSGGETMDAIGEDDEEGLVSLGIGGQIGFGWDALQVGMGYDVLTRHRYFLIGIGVPDAIKLIERLRK